MNNLMLRILAPALCLFAAQLHSQPSPAPAPAGPVYSQTIALVKVPAGMGEDYVQLMRDTSMKVAQMRADAGEIVAWTFLRNVMPSGEDARANYMISTISVGPPPPPMDRTAFEAALKKAGSTVSVDDFYARRTSLSSLVAYELWQVREWVGAAQKGHYIFRNSMKVHDPAAYGEFESRVWRPLAEAWVKEGAMSGWLYSTKMLPSGTDTAYSASTVDIFPTWEAAFASRSIEETFAKVHPGVSLDETWNKVPALRDLAQRELWVVVERVGKRK